MRKILTPLAILFAIIVIQACSNQAERVYDESSYGLPLEVPPDLTKPVYQQEDLSFIQDKKAEAMAGSNVNSNVSSDAGCNCNSSSSQLQPLPEQKNLVLHKDGSQQWLVLQGDPRNIWPWVRNFWVNNGFKISLEDPLIGFIETDWKQQINILPLEKSVDGKDLVVVGQDVVSKDSDEKIYAVPQLEKYRVRLEKGEAPGTTELFLTHRGVELVAQDKLIVWKLKKTDPELEVQMIKQMLVYFSNEQQTLGSSLASRNQVLNIATMITNEKKQATLKVDIEFIRLWRRVGLVLDRMDYIIESSDRSVGSYHLRVKDPLIDENVKEEKGWFSSLFSGDDGTDSSRIQVVLRDEGESTHINVYQESGKVLDDEKSKVILEKIKNHLQ